MSKRAPQFEKKERNYYPTPATAVRPLLPFLSPVTMFYEPCAGDGSLADELVWNGHICVRMSDIAPQRDDIVERDALQFRNIIGSCFITNPPWDVEVMHPILEHLTSIKPVWFLLYADWLFTRQAGPYIPMASHIVAVGRVKWFPDSPHQGKDNTCWVRFDRAHAAGPTFYGR